MGWARAVLAVGAFTATTDGLAWLLFPTLTNSTAYTLATSLIPQWIWGAAMLSSGLAITVAGWLPYWLPRSSLPEWLIRVAALGYGSTCWVVAVSILALTLNGSVGAFTGASKWLAVALGALALLMPRQGIRRGFLP